MTGLGMGGSKQCLLSQTPLVAMQKGVSGSRPGAQAAVRQTQLSQGKADSPLIVGGPKKPSPKGL